MRSPVLVLPLALRPPFAGLALKALMALASALTLTSLGLVAGCDSGLSSGTPGGNDALDPRSCSPLVKQVPYEGATHVPEGTSVSYSANPPASGNHWPIWSPWGAFLDTVVPRERWVHNLEHGGVVLLFNCPDVSAADLGGVGDAGGPPGPSDGGAAPPCPELSQPLAALRSERKPDKFGVVRVLVTADPRLPARFAAVAWNWSLVGSMDGGTVDADALRCFIDKRYGQGPEDAP